MDSLLERNDTVFHFSNLSTLPFIFLPKAAVGQSWTVSPPIRGMHSVTLLSPVPA
jgi:hypothetical protein